MVTFFVQQMNFGWITLFVERRSAIFFSEGYFTCTAYEISKVVKVAVATLCVYNEH